MAAAKNTTIASPRAAIRVAIKEEIKVEAPRVVVDKRRIKTRDLRPQTPNDKNHLLSNLLILNKRSSRALLPRKTIREVIKAVKINSSDLRQLRPNKHQLQNNNSLKKKKRARLPGLIRSLVWEGETVEAGVQ